MSKVVHVMRNKYDVYIGRPGIFGNPFTHKNGTRALEVVASREEAIEKFEDYARNNKELMKELPKLKGKVLGCWCAGSKALTEQDQPFRCHGQVLLKLLSEIEK